MKLIIAGSRPKYLNLGHTMMENICRHFNFHPRTVSEVVCGMAIGVDEKGKYWAWEQSIPVKKFPADWDNHKNAAGPIRNEEMAQYADSLLLIWNGKSPGSSDMKQQMLKLDKPIYEVVIKEPTK